MPTQALETNATAQPNTDPLTILLVEDNADDALLLERHLRRAGFRPVIARVETASAYQEALASSPKPHIVLADYNLPLFSGPEALRLLRSSGLDIPFIMMSGAMSEETAVDSMRAGAQDYVIKQNLARLVPAVERELREAEARRSRLAAEAALKASEARFRRLVDAMPIGLLLGDSDGAITFANDAAGALLGYSADALLQGAVRLDQLGISFDEVAAAQTDLLSAQYEHTFTRPDGTTRNLLLGVAVLNAAEARTGELAIFLVDLSKQKQGEEVLRRTEKLAVAGRLAASIAHEINNPLAAVTNCLYLVASTDLTEEGRSFLDTAQKELDRVAQITVQTLRFHRQSSRPVHSDIRELAETVLTLFDSRLRRQQIAVHRDFGKVQPLLAFEGEIRQVIVNLLGNAIDASGSPGEIFLRTRQLRVPHRECEGIVLTVGDKGSGIPQNALQHLFEPFFSTKGITGTGLGLWVSKEIVERHGGTIFVHTRQRTADRPGGTVFRVFLPLGGVPTPAPAAERAPTL